MAKPSVDKDLIRELADLLEETGLSEIEIEQEGLRLKVSRQGATAVHNHVSPAPAPEPAPAPAATAPEPEAPAEEEDFSNHPGVVTSPMVGTVYIAPEPGAAPYIKVGDHVAEGQTLLIVEAMKTLNPIPAPRPGRVAQILIKDSEPVEFGEPLVVLD